MEQGKFITLEGGEGSGKSTQVKHLVAFLAQHGQQAIATREVGGAPGAEEIRRLWLEKNEGYWDRLTEVMLIMAARREHLVKTIWPALEKGTWVICDRFVDSTRAYQGLSMGIGVDRIDTLYNSIASNFKPDLTLLLDLGVKTGLARMHARCGQDDRYQQQSAAFHETVRHAYRTLAEAEMDRFCIIDAAQDESRVTSAIEFAVHQRLGFLPNGL